MLKKSHFIILALSALMLGAFFGTGCQKSQTQDAPATETPAAVQKVLYTCFYEGLSLKDAPGGAYKESLSFGEKVEYLGETQDDSKGNAHLKIRTQSGAEGWSSVYYFVENGYPAVVIAEDRIYTEPEPKGVTPDTLPVAHLVCVDPDGSSDNKYVAVHYLHPETGYVQQGRFMKTGSVSTSSNDVDAAVLLLLARRAMEKEDTDAAVTYLETAMDEFSGSVLSRLIGKELALAKEGSSAVQVETVTLEVPLAATVNSGNVNVRKEPSLSSPVTGQLDTGAAVQVSMKTREPVDVNDTSDFWYYTENADGVKGWIFGVFLSF